jgi:hypothetical protein
MQELNGGFSSQVQQMQESIKANTQRIRKEPFRKSSVQPRDVVKKIIEGYKLEWNSGTMRRGLARKVRKALARLGLRSHVAFHEGDSDALKGSVYYQPNPSVLEYVELTFTLSAE